MSVLILLLLDHMLLHLSYIRATVEMCGDGVDNNNDGQIEEKCGEDEEEARNRQGLTSESSSDVIDLRDNTQRSNQVQEKELHREDFEESSFYGDSEANTDRSNDKNGTRATNERLSNVVSNSTQQYQAYERSMVTLLCQMCINFNLNSIHAQSYTWSQVGGAHQVVLVSYNTSKTSFVAPEINSPIDVLNFMVKVIDDRGIVYNERIEVLIKNMPEIVG